MDIYVQEITQSIFVELPDAQTFWRVSARMVAATVLGGIVGWQRESEGKAAGLRTHMIVSLAASTVVIVCMESAMAIDHLARVIEGILTGVGFIGAGAILKNEAKERIKGLTTAATILLTTVVGITTGLGWLWVSCLIICLALLILMAMARFEPPANKEGQVR